VTLYWKKIEIAAPW